MARGRRRDGARAEWSAVASQVRARNERTADIDRELHAAILRLAGSLRGRKVLELGCGTGALVRVLTARGALATGVDVSARAIRVAERDARASGLPRVPRFATGDAEEGRSLPRARFDLILMVDLVGELEDPQSALRNAARRLSSRGQLILAIPPARSQRERPLEQLFGDLRAAQLCAVDLLERVGRASYTIVLAEPAARPRARRAHEHARSETKPRGARSRTRNSRH